MKYQELVALAEMDISTKLKDEVDRFKAARLYYDEPFFSNVRLDYKYKMAIGEALVREFNNLAVPLWVAVSKGRLNEED